MQTTIIRSWGLDTSNQPEFLFLPSRWRSFKNCVCNDFRCVHLMSMLWSNTIVKLRCYEQQKAVEEWQKLILLMSRLTKMLKCIVNFISANCIFKRWVITVSSATKHNWTYLNYATYLDNCMCSKLSLKLAFKDITATEFERGYFQA